MLRTLQNRLWNPLGELRENSDFLSLFAGRLVTNIGDSFYFIAAMWLAYTLTGSPLYTGAVGFMSRAPSALSFLLGPVVDRTPTRRLLVLTQLANALLVLVIPVAAAIDMLSVWLLLVVLPVVTIINELVYPAQEAAVPQLVDEEHLTAANSLISSSGQAANIGINAVSGALIPLVGAVSLFVVNSVSFAVAMLLFANVGRTALSTSETDPSADPTDSSATAYVADLREAYNYVQSSLLPPFIWGSIVINLASGIMLGVLPVYADSLGGPLAYGLLSAAFSGGAFAGFVVASTAEEYPFGKFISVSFSAAGLVYGAAIALSWLPVTLLLFSVTMVPIGIYNILLRTVLQSTVDVDLLGRVSALLRSATSVALPVGSAVGGSLATVIGVRSTMYSLSAGLLIFGVYVAVRSDIRSLTAAAAIEGETLGLGAPSPTDD